MLHVQSYHYWNICTPYIHNQNSAWNWFMPTSAGDNTLFAWLVLENISSYLKIKNIGCAQFIPGNWESCSMDQHMCSLVQFPPIQTILWFHWYSTYNIWTYGHLGYSNQEEIQAYLTGLSNTKHIQLINICRYGSSRLMNGWISTRNRILT